MWKRRVSITTVLILCAVWLGGNVPQLAAQDRPVSGSPYAAVTEEVAKKIREEGMERSQVMDTLRTLTDVIGPRLTGSPQMYRANEWARDKMKEWGLEGRLEPWGPFGRGWTIKSFTIQAVEPQCIPLIAFPKAWTPGLEGTLRAQVVYYNPKDEADLERFRGKLKGSIVLIGEPKETPAWFEPPAKRYSDAELLARANAAAPEDRRRGAGPGRRPGGDTGAEQEFARKRQALLREEPPALLIEPSFRGDGGTIFVQSASLSRGALTDDEALLRKRPWDPDVPAMIPQIVLAIEHYNRLVRMVEAGETPVLEVALEVEFHEGDMMAYNTIAEIPGSDPELSDEVVMLGGHLDSWHCGTGATDNASGCSVAMEAVRILQALDLKPRRTVRVALWSGEEQGLLGSRAYVAEHFVRKAAAEGDGAPAPSAATPESLPLASLTTGTSRTALDLTDAAENFNVYFNLDNGTGKIRGLYMEGNEAVRPIFRRWLEPFRDLGADTLTISRTGGTDHMSFNAIGLPGFQFIQDPVEYDTRTHHSTMDVYDRIQAEDMKQASIIMATLVYNAAMSEEKLPRKELPKPEPSSEATPVEGRVAAGE